MIKQEDQFYKHLELLEEGIYWKLHLVVCIEDKSLWVIKKMDLSIMKPQEKEQILREAKQLELLSRPNIVKIKEIYQTKQQILCIVMEYSDGETLSQKIQKAKDIYLPETQILDWFIQICQGIKYIHDSKIIHQNLNGQNIFLKKDGQVKLGNFGYGNTFKIQFEKCIRIDKFEKPYYKSPEILKGDPITFMTDIWSLGVILYELCALQLPFNAQNFHSFTQCILNNQYKPISSHYSNHIKLLIQSLLQIDSKKRPTIKEILFLFEIVQTHTVALDNLILNEQLYPHQLLEQNAKSVQPLSSNIKIQKLNPILLPELTQPQQKSSPSRHSDSQKDLQKIVPQQNKIYVSPKHQQQINQQRPPTAPNDTLNIPRPKIAQQRLLSSKIQYQDLKVMKIERIKPTSIEKAPSNQQQQKYEQSKEQLQTGKILLLKQRENQEHLQKELQIQSKLFKEKQSQEQLQEKQLLPEKYQEQEEKGKNLINKQKQNFEGQLQFSFKLDNKNNESNQQMKQKFDQFQQVDKFSNDCNYNSKQKIIEHCVEDEEEATAQFNTQI